MAAWRAPDAAGAVLSAPAATRETLPGEGALRIALRDDVNLEAEDGANLRVKSPFGSLLLKNVAPGARAALDALSAGNATLDALSETVIATDGGQSLALFYHYLDRLARQCVLTHTAVSDGEALATIVGISRLYRFALRAIDPAQQFRLSRFAFLRRDGDRLIVESPLGFAQIVLHQMSAAGVLTELSRPISADGLVTALPTLEAEAVYGLLQLLLNGQMLTAETESGSEEDADARLATWAPHDLLFHARSRFGRNTGPFGASFRFVGRIPSLPAVKPKPAGETIPLDKPDLDSAMKSDPPLAAMMEERRSIYEYGSQPISIRQLGEFLYRVARVREVHRTQLQAGRDGATIEFLETTSRPYPSGGKSYDLEFYLAVDRCEGLSSGLYHYDPLGHGLTRVREADDRVEALLHYVSVAAPGSRPQVLIILASRFQRLSWKYDAIAYAATLKHVGVLFQSMYLVATAMGLAGSALGSGDADLFAEAAGTDYLSETSVGEFMLGSAPDQTAEREANGK